MINLIPEVNSVVIVILNFAQQHLGGHPTNIKTGSNYAGEAWDHLPANLQPIQTRNGNLFLHNQAVKASSSTSALVISVLK